MNFVEVTKVDELPAGTMTPFSIEGKEILVINYGGKHYAIGGMYPYGWRPVKR